MRLIWSAQPYYSSLIHVNQAVVVEWQPKKGAQDTWCYMTSHEAHFDEHVTPTPMPH